MGGFLSQRRPPSLLPPRKEPLTGRLIPSSPPWKESRVRRSCLPNTHQTRIRPAWRVCLGPGRPCLPPFLTRRRRLGRCSHSYQPRPGLEGRGSPLARRPPTPAREGRQRCCCCRCLRRPSSSSQNPIAVSSQPRLSQACAVTCVTSVRRSSADANLRGGKESAMITWRGKDSCSSEPQAQAQAWLSMSKADQA